EPVTVGVADQRVRAGEELQLVRQRVAVDSVLVPARDDGVRPRLAGDEHVPAAPAVTHVPTVPTVEPVVTGTSDQQVLTVRPRDLVVPRPAVERVGPVLPGEDVVTAPTEQDVVAVAPVQQI